MNGAGGFYFSPGENMHNMFVTIISFDQISDRILRRIIDRTVFSCQNITMTESTETDQNSDQVISNLLYLAHLGEM